MSSLRYPHFLLCSIVVFLILRFTTHTVLVSLAISLCVCVPSYLLYACYLFPYYLSALRHVPTPPNAHPILGHFPALFQDEMCRPMRHWHKDLGPVIRVLYPFGLERISIVADEDLKEVTIRNPYNYVRMDRIIQWMGAFLGLRGVLLAEGAEHSRLRKALAPAFSTQAIHGLEYIFWGKALRLAELLGRERKEGEVFATELLDWTNRATLDIIGAAAFGEDINSLEEPEHPLRRAFAGFFQFDLLSNVIILLLSVSQLFMYLPCQATRTFAASQQAVREYAGRVVQNKYTAEKRNGRDVMALIVKENERQKERGSGLEMDFETVRDQVITFLGAGHDTTATSLAWCLHQLARHPDVQDRLREEVLCQFPALAGGEISVLRERVTAEKSVRSLIGEVDSLGYLENVCRESLRFIPSVPMTGRTNVQSASLGGYDIPPDTLIGVSANAVNFWPGYWGDDAERFDPDRWDHLPETWVPNAYNTFHAGPRGCIGRKFAETEMKVILCCLVAQFEFMPDNAFENPEVGKIWRLVLHPKEGMHLKLRLLERAREAERVDSASECD